MAIGDPTVRTTVSQKSSANPWTGAAIESQINAGEYAVAILASDNIGGESGVDGASTRSFLSDSEGNYWQKVAEYTDEAAAGSGESVSVFVSKISRTLTTSDTFAAHFLVSGNRTLGAKGLIVLAGSIGAGKRLRAETTLNQFAAGAVDPASSALAALTSREHLYLRAISYCGPDTVILTPTAGYTAVGANGSGSGTTGAAANTNKTAIAEWKKATSTGDTSDPATNTDLAHANIFCALWEDNEWTGPTFIGIGTPATGVAAVSPGIPVGWAADDIFVLAAECNSGETVTVAGWTQFPDSPQDASAGTRLTLLWKRAAAGETAPTTNDPGDHIYAVIFGIRGCPTTGNPFDVTSGNNEGATLDTSVSVTGDTTTVTNTLVAVLTAHGFDIGTDGSTMFTSWVNADLALLEERWDGGTQQGSGGGLGILTGEKASAGSYAASTATSTSSTGHANMTVAFKAGKVVPVGQVTETDISQQVKWNPKKRLIPQLVETDISAAMGKAKSRIVGDSAISDVATLFDTFDRANSATLGTASGGFTWTEMTGGTDISSNQAMSANSGGSVGNLNRANSVLSVDHFAEIEFRAQTDTGDFPTADALGRVDSAVSSCYAVWYDPSVSKCKIDKIQSGVVRTNIATEAGTHGPIVAGDKIKISCVGTTIKGFFNGVEHVSVVDSSLTTQTRTGFGSNQGGNRATEWADNFSAGNAAAASHLFELNTAQPINRVKSEPAAQVLETDLSRFIRSPVKVNRAIETDVVTVVARPKIINLGQSTENDICITEWPGYGEAYQGISIRERKSRTLTQILETDISRPVTKLGITRIPTQVVETDIATAVTKRKLKATLQALETDISQPIARLKSKIAIQALETDISQIITRRKTKVIQMATENDLAEVAGGAFSTVSTVATWTTASAGAWLLSTFKTAVDGVSATQVQNLGASVSALSITVTFSAPTAGNKLVVSVGVAVGVTPGWSNAEGWTEEFDDGRMALFSKISNGTETSATFTIGGGVSRALRAIFFEESGLGAIDEVASGSFASGTTTTPITSGAVDQSTEWGLVMLMFDGPITAGSGGFTNGFTLGNDGTRSRSGVNQNIVQVGGVAQIGVDPKKSRAAAQVIETDLSRVITKPVTAIPVAQALETDISAVVRKMLLVDIEFVAENDTVDPFFKRKSKAIGMTTETDVSFGTAKRLKTQYVNQSVETDIANLTGRLKTKVVAQSLETNIATALLKTKLKAVAQALETDLGRAMLAIRSRAVNQAVETDISSLMTRRKTKVFAQAIETDIATVTARLKRKTFGQVTETDVSQPIKWKVTRFVNRAIETDLATAMAHLKQKLVQQVIETSISTAMLKRKLKVLAQAIETDLGQIISRQKLKVFGQATETDLSRLILYAETRPVNRVTETDIAFAIKKLKQRLFNQVVETDIAQHLGTAFQLGVHQITESDISQPMVRLKKRILGQSLETDLAQVFTHTKNLLTRQVIEYDSFVPDSIVAPPIEAAQGAAGSTFTNIQNIPMPNGSNVIGKTLVSIVCPMVGAATFIWPTGWVPFETTTPPFGPRFHAAYHIVDGTEGWDGVGDVLTLTFDAPSRFVAQTFRLPANVPMPPECEVAFQQDVLDNANPPLIVPAGGLKPYLLICGFVVAGFCTGDVAPVGYGGLLASTHSASTSGRGSMTTAYKTATTASDDPDVFGTANGDGTNDGTMFTIAIQPVGGGVLRVLKSKTLSQTAETDIAQSPIAKRKLKVVGQSLETDTADVLGLGESVIVGKATENDLARIASKALGVHLLQATESDLAALLKRMKRRGSGQATENDIARFLTSGFSTPLDTAVETDLSFALKQVRAKIIARAIETDQTTPLILLKYKTIGQAVEYDLAFALLVAPFAPNESVITDATPEAVLTDVTPVAFLIETPVSELTDLVPIVVFVLSTPEAIITGVEAVPKALSREEVEMSLLRMIRGESAEWDVLVRHPITKQPINLTGKGLRFMAKREYDDENANAIIDVTTPSAITIVDPTGGLAHIKVPSASTLDLDNERTRLVYEFEVTSGADKSKSDSGYLVVNPQVVLP